MRSNLQRRARQWRERIVGLDERLPLLDGRTRPYINLDNPLDINGRRVALLTVTGASNETGNVQPIHRLARKVHAVGARILVDAAQLAPHRRADMKPADDPEHLDFVALSAHTRGR